MGKTRLDNKDLEEKRKQGESGMKLTMRALLSLVICLLVISTALARKPEVQPTATVAGVYENFTVGKGSGDLEGMRVVIVPAGVGYYAIVQIAQGGAEESQT